MKMCNAFAGGGHDVTLFAYRVGKDVDVHAYYGVKRPFSIRPLPLVPLPGLKRLTRALAAAHGVRRLPPPELIYGRDLYSLLAAVGTSVPVVYEAHMPPQTRSDARLVKRLLDAKNVVRLVVISDALAQRFTALYPALSPSRVVVAHDAADEPSFDASSAPLEWHGRPGVAQIVYAGSLLPGKGAELVVALARKLPQYDFHLVGGSEEDVRKIRAESGGQHGNLFTHGHVAHQRVAEYLRRAQIALLPSQQRVIVSSGADIGEWMSPLKLFEYMACRLPIVASALPVMREVLVDGENALLVPAGDLDAWTHAVDRLAADAALRERLASRAFEDFHERYTWAKRSERVLAGLHV
jgi:glycosyltransferase involved in cell wall biosynthesis